MKLTLFSTEGEGNSYSGGIMEKNGLGSDVPRFCPQGSLQVVLISSCDLSIFRQRSLQAYMNLSLSLSMSKRTPLPKGFHCAEFQHGILFSFLP